MSSLESLCEDIRTNVTVWKRYRDKGGSDPFWSDGDNMNLCRNHIIDDRRRIEEIIARDGIEPPAELLIPVPPEVSAEFMAHRLSAAERKRLIMLDPQPDLVEIAEALDIMSKPHYGSKCWLNAAINRMPCSTERQEAIWETYGDGRLG